MMDVESESCVSRSSPSSSPRRCSSSPHDAIAAASPILTTAADSSPTCSQPVESSGVAGSPIAESEKDEADRQSNQQRRHEGIPEAASSLVMSDAHVRSTSGDGCGDGVSGNRDASGLPGRHDALPVEDNVADAAGCRLSKVTSSASATAAESSISKLESFVASLSQQQQRQHSGTEQYAGVPPLASSVSETGGHLTRLLVAENNMLGVHRRLTSTSPPLDGQAMTANVGRQPDAGFQRPTANLTESSSSFASGLTGNAQLVGYDMRATALLGVCRKDEPLDLSVKSVDGQVGIGIKRKSGYDAIGEESTLHSRSIKNIRPSSEDGLASKQAAGGLHVQPPSSRGGDASTGNSLACLERDFGENSMLLSRIGSLSKLKQVNRTAASGGAGIGGPPGPTANGVAGQLNSRAATNSHHVPSNRYSYPQASYHHQQIMPTALSCPMSFPPRPYFNGHHQFPVVGCQPMAPAGHAYAQPHLLPSGLPGTVRYRQPPPYGGVLSANRSSVEQLLAVDVGKVGASKSGTWMTRLRGCGAGVTSHEIDRRNRRTCYLDQGVRHHQLSTQAQTLPRNGLAMSSALPTTKIGTGGATNAGDIRCLECNDKFASLPELTLHMFHAGHYANIVRAAGGAVPNSIAVPRDDVTSGSATNRMWNSNDGGRDAVVTNKRPSAGSWPSSENDSAAVIVSPTKSVDDESVSSTGYLTEVRSGSAESGSPPVKSPLSSASSSEERRRATDPAAMMSLLMAQLDPLIARTILGYSADILFGGTLSSSRRHASSSTGLSGKGEVGGRAPAGDSDGRETKEDRYASARKRNQADERRRDGAKGVSLLERELTSPVDYRCQQQSSHIYRLDRPVEDLRSTSSRGSLMVVSREKNADEGPSRQISSSSSSSLPSSSQDFAVRTSPSDQRDTLLSGTKRSAEEPLSTTRSIASDIPEKCRAVVDGNGDVWRSPSGNSQRHQSPPTSAIDLVLSSTVKLERDDDDYQAEEALVPEARPSSVPDTNPSSWSDRRGPVPGFDDTPVDDQPRRHELHRPTQTACRRDGGTGSEQMTAIDFSRVGSGRPGNGNTGNGMCKMVDRDSDDGVPASFSQHGVNLGGDGIASVVADSGNEDSEYVTRFGKYCRLARELAERAN